MAQAKPKGVDAHHNLVALRAYLMRRHLLSIGVFPVKSLFVFGGLRRHSSVGLVLDVEEFGRVKKHTRAGRRSVCQAGFEPGFRRASGLCTRFAHSFSNSRRNRYVPKLLAVANGVHMRQVGLEVVIDHSPCPFRCPRFQEINVGVHPMPSPTNWQAISPPSVVTTARTRPLSSGRISFSSVFSRRSMRCSHVAANESPSSEGVLPPVVRFAHQHRNGNVAGKQHFGQFDPDKPAPHNHRPLDAYVCFHHFQVLQPIKPLHTVAFCPGQLKSLDTEPVASTSTSYSSHVPSAANRSGFDRRVYPAPVQIDAVFLPESVFVGFGMRVGHVAHVDIHEGRA